jgi:predicted lipoprotein with Yx(FWY)xxD motif
MNDNKKTKTKTTIIAAATILVVVASVAMIGTQMSQYALAKHAARDPPSFVDETLLNLYGYSGKVPTESNVAPGCQVQACG